MSAIAKIPLPIHLILSIKRWNWVQWLLASNLGLLFFLSLAVHIDFVCCLLMCDTHLYSKFRYFEILEKGKKEGFVETASLGHQLCAWHMEWAKYDFGEWTHGQSTQKKLHHYEKNYLIILSLIFARYLVSVVSLCFFFPIHLLSFSAKSVQQRMSNG